MLSPIRLAALLVAIGALGCSATPAPAGSKPAGATHTIVIKGLKFVPERLEVAAGDTVVWKNEDIVPHKTSARDVFESANLEKGESWSYVASAKGKHAYVCTYHPTMNGELVVN